MIQFAIYESPSDFPGRFVVRRFTIGPLRATPDERPHSVYGEGKAP